MKKARLFFLASLLFGAFPASAVCPLCTVAVGSGMGFSRWLGIDDTVTSLWIGGLTVSMIMWTFNWLEKKNINFKGKKILVISGFYLLIAVSLFWVEGVRGPLNQIWGINKVLLGTILGSLAFWAGAKSYAFLKEKNQGRAYFPFQKVVMPVLPLLVLSLAFYFLTK